MTEQTKCFLKLLVNCTFHKVIGFSISTGSMWHLENNTMSKLVIYHTWASGSISVRPVCVVCVQHEHTIRSLSCLCVYVCVCVCLFGSWAVFFQNGLGGRGCRAWNDRCGVTCDGNKGSVEAQSPLFVCVVRMSTKQSTFSSCWLSDELVWLWPVGCKCVNWCLTETRSPVEVGVCFL